MARLLNLKAGTSKLADLSQGIRAGTLLAGTAGNDYFVDPANGNNANSGTTPGNAFASIATAFAACTANQHDCVWYIAGSSGINLSAALNWNKNYTHLVGICAPTRTAQRSRIFQLSTLTGASPLLTVSATGCIFQNFYIFQGVNDATSLINVSVTGQRNYFENVHFAGGGHAAQAIDGGASLMLNGAAENTFLNCTIGVDTIDAATGMMCMLMDGDALRNRFIDCDFIIEAGHTGAGFVEVVDSTGIDRYNIFRNCTFLNSNAPNFTIASAFVIPAIAANRPSRLYLFNCMGYGFSKWDASDRVILFGNMDAVTGADLSGVAKELVTA